MYFSQILRILSLQERQHDMFYSSRENLNTFGGVQKSWLLADERKLFLQFLLYFGTILRTKIHFKPQFQKNLKSKIEMSTAQRTRRTRSRRAGTAQNFP